MLSSFESSAFAVRRLAEVAVRLEAAVREFDLDPLHGREWFDLLERKLLPQLGDDSFLIVAVVGGTNIGKSVLFNHLAGARVSSTSPLASGTKHPTALLPSELAGRIDLPALFPGFQLRKWENADQPLRDDQEHLLFFRECTTLPRTLIVLDTPDVDSVAQVNWERAAHIRQSADVLMALLTQQKYNDAAVKEFFRKAAQEEKLVIVVFNQCDFPEDEEYWPQWLRTFCEETGVVPHAVYLAPRNRRAAEANELPFHERPWPVEPDVSAPGEELHAGVPTVDREPSLLGELSELKFGEIKLRTLSGALKQVVDEHEGVPGWLAEIRHRAEQHQDALQLMESERLVEIERWPTLPNAVLIEQVRHWWRGQREGWSAAVHGFYNRLGELVVAPVVAIRNRTASQRLPPLEIYRQREWEAILGVMQEAIKRLEWLRDLGHPLLKARLVPLLAGASRAELLDKVKQAHDDVHFESRLQSLIAGELAHFREESPGSYQLLRRLDAVAAATRPAISVVLFMTGAGPVGEALMPAVTETALQGALHLAGNAVGGTAVTLAGDKAITEGASTGMGYLEARFLQLHKRFISERAAWMAGQLEEHLFGTLPRELAESAAVVSSEEYQRVHAAVDDLRKLIATLK